MMGNTDVLFWTGYVFGVVAGVFATLIVMWLLGYFNA